MFLFLSSILAMIISFMLIIISFFISFYPKEYMNKCSPFECGFDPMSNNRLPFSIRFFLLAVIFLIFDLEIILLFPFLAKNFLMVNYMSMLSCFIFLLILLFGTMYEWKKGALSWTS